MTTPFNPDRLAIIAEAIARGETYVQIGWTFGLSRERIRQIVKRHGLETANSSWPKARARKESRIALREERYFARRAFLAPFVERVRNGESVNSITENRSLHKSILNECKRLGVKINSKSRWYDFSERRLIVERGIALRQTWAAITADVCAAEGRTISRVAIMLWAGRNLDAHKERA